jgi:AcrR family transcriptional regulator
VPRKPDPDLERNIVEAATRLLEKGGLEAVTMREVAKAAETTTPTLYERFADRDALIVAVTNVFRDKLITILDPDDSLELLGRKFMDFCADNPNAVGLLVGRMASNLKSRSQGPVYEMVRKNLMKTGFSAQDAEEITLATTSTMVGAAMLMCELGANTRAGKDLQHAMIKLLQRVVRSNRNGSN